MCPRSSARSAESKSARTATTTRRRRSTLDQSGRKVSKDRKDHPESREPAEGWVRVATVDLLGRRARRVHAATLALLGLPVLAENRVVTVEMDFQGLRAVKVSYPQNFSQP